MQGNLLDSLVKEPVEGVDADEDEDADDRCDHSSCIYVASEYQMEILHDPLRNKMKIDN